MFKFQRLFSGGGKWTSNLFIEEDHIGTIGLDEEGLFIKSNRRFTLHELNLLIAQLGNNDPQLLGKELEILKAE